MSAQQSVSEFIEDAPPGELPEVVADLRSLTSTQPALLTSAPARQAFRRHTEAQFTTTKLPGSSTDVLITPFNLLEDSGDTGKYYDPGSNTSFNYDWVAQKSSFPEPYTPSTANDPLATSLLKALTSHVTEHYPTGASFSAYASDSAITIAIASNKYSPSNFWNARWRAHYVFSPSSSSITGGRINVDVHYYEDGNVRLQTQKNVGQTSCGGGSAAEVVRALAGVEKAYQEELNRGFNALNEGAFKGLRRQLPVTRQKVEWEKVGGYRLGQDLGGGSARAGR